MLRFLLPCILGLLLASCSSETKTRSRDGALTDGAAKRFTKIGTDQSGISFKNMISTVTMTRPIPHTPANTQRSQNVFKTFSTGLYVLRPKWTFLKRLYNVVVRT